MPAIPATRQFEPVLLRDHEVAAVLNISKTAAYLKMASGEIPGVIRIGRSIRVHRATLLVWLEAMAREGSAAT